MLRCLRAFPLLHLLAFLLSLDLRRVWLMLRLFKKLAFLLVVFDINDYDAFFYIPNCIKLIIEISSVTDVLFGLGSNFRRNCLARLHFLLTAVIRITFVVRRGFSHRVVKVRPTHLGVIFAVLGGLQV